MVKVEHPAPPVTRSSSMKKIVVRRTAPIKVTSAPSGHTMLVVP